MHSSEILCIFVAENYQYLDISDFVTRFHLASKHQMDYDELDKWYDGYQIGDQPSIFNPNSVMQAIYNGYCRSYWASTGAYEAVAKYISMNFDGLKDDILVLLAGGRVKVNTTKFQNDMSKDLLQATLNGDEEAVAHGIDLAHDENTSILSYNNENSLACVLSIAYYFAKNNYVMHRERLRVGERSSGMFASGKGFADIVLIPRKHVDSPAIVLELKYDQDADTAINQIKQKNYPERVVPYTKNLLLVGINYDKQQKTHTCRIKRL